jgi:hypothetical protein
MSIPLSLSQFWGTSEVAGPTVWDVLRVWDRSPRFLRLTGRTRPPSLFELTEPVRIQSEHAPKVAEFWRIHYGGEDWRLDADAAWVAERLRIPNTVLLAAITSQGRILGTIVCAPFSESRVRIGSAELPTLWVIEGLCIHREFRGKHLAGWLIAWVDHWMCREPQAFLWSRELPTPVLGTAIQCATYGYVRGADIRNPTLRLDPFAWSDFRQYWAAAAPSWSLDSAIVPTTLPTHVPDLRVWSCGTILLCIAATRRRTIPGGEAISEIIWMGRMAEEGLQPWEGPGPKAVLESAAALLGGVLFGSTLPHQGGIQSWPHPWSVGNSGVHATYLYNFMPPSFGFTTVYSIRNDV